MSVNNMLTIPVYLEAQPAMGAKPELHLKERMNSVTVELYILDRTGLSDLLSKTCVVSGKLPGGEHFFYRTTLVGDWGRYRVSIYNRYVRMMCQTAGTYECNLTVLDARSASVTEDTFMDYDAQTVLPFTVIVEKAARRAGNA